MSVVFRHSLIFFHLLEVYVSILNILKSVLVGRQRMLIECFKNGRWKMESSIWHVTLLSPKKRRLSVEEDILEMCDPSSTKKQFPVEEVISCNKVTCQVCATQNRLGIFFMVSIKDDGNCLLRALSHCLHHD